MKRKKITFILIIFIILIILLCGLFVYKKYTNKSSSNTDLSNQNIQNYNTPADADNEIIPQENEITVFNNGLNYVKYGDYIYYREYNASNFEKTGLFHSWEYTNSDDFKCKMIRIKLLRTPKLFYF